MTDTSTSTNWQTIRDAYEHQGVSQRTLATQYHVSQSAISKHCIAEGWVLKSVVTPVSQPLIDNFPDPDEITTPAIAAKLLQHIDRIVREEPDTLDPRAIKLLCDGLSQIYKIQIMAAAHEQPTTKSGIPAELLAFLSMDKLQILAEHRRRIDDILDEARSKMLESEAGIRTIGTAYQR